MFTIGVFRDAAWADKGIAALLADGFEPESLSLVAKASAEAEHLIGTHLQAAGQAREVPGLGTVTCCGPLVALFDRDGRSEAAGLRAVCARAGFQAHDGHIYEMLVERGGVLVAVQSEARAADALSRLHAYGGGNAAIGVYRGGPLVP